jgi:DNA polymerase-3 subunit gamma/tau
VPEILYRKWRPRSFSELAGQEHIAATLTNALASGRVAHAYLFAGPRGTGKTSAGRLLGKALNCPERVAGEACNRCESCLSYLAGRAMDLVELDAASNRGIDEIRSLRDKVAFAPGAGEFKVYLIDEVHMLTEAAFNAMLKTLEEPPPHVVFILATTETHKVPATIASRCQRFDFRRPPLASIVGNLERICEGEGFSCQPDALELIARSATGSHRDAVNLLDQLVTSYGGELTLEHVRTGLGLIGDGRAALLARQALTSDLAGGLETIGSVRDDGLDLRQFQRELVDELRNLLLVKSGVEPAEGITAERKQDLREAVEGVETSRLLRALRSFGEADLKLDPNSTLPLDIALAECVLGEDTGIRAYEHAGSEAGGKSGSRAVGQAQRTAGSSTNQQTSSAARSRSAQGDPPPPSSDPRSTEPSAPARPESLEGRGASASHELDDTRRPDDLTTSVPLTVHGEKETAGEGEVARALANSGHGLRAIYERAGTGSPVGALIGGACDIIAADERSITLGFKFEMHAQKMLQPENLTTLKRIVSEVTGRDLDVMCEYDSKVESWRQRERANRSPLVRAAQEMGARVISSEPEDSR